MAGLNLASVALDANDDSSAPLAPIAGDDGKAVVCKSHGRKLAVCARSDGTLVLAREVERIRKVKDPADPNKRVPVLGADGKPERERVYKATPEVLDFARAVAGGILAL